MSVQHKLSITQPPRVQITYDVETGGAQQQRELPFVLGVISDLAGKTTLGNIRDRRFISLDAENFDEVMTSINPSIELNIDGKPTLVYFKKFEDFSPDSFAEKIPSLKTNLALRTAIVDLSSMTDANPALDDAIVKLFTGKGNLEEVKKYLLGTPEEVKTLLDTLNAKEVLERAKEATNASHHFGSVVLKLDQSLSRTLDGILHNPAFRQLEASWTGIRSLLATGLIGERIKLRVLPITRAELEQDLAQAPAFDLSNTFKEVYEKEYGTPGGIPYSCLIADLYFGRGNEDLELARKLSEIACASHAPLITSVNAGMFGLTDFEQLASVNRIHKIFESSGAAKFKALRDCEESCYLTFAMPRVMMRAPYSPEENPIRKFNYTETIANNEHFCWGNAAYAVAVRILEAYGKYSWVAAIRGVEGGGLINNLPQYVFKTEQGDPVLQCPTEVHITDRQEKALSDMGFLPLSSIKHTVQAVIIGGQTVQKPKMYLDNDATANSAVSVRLPYVLNACRFAHYIKVMMRDKVGTHMTAVDVEYFLQGWLAQYVLLSDLGSQDIKASYPLREGRVQVAEDDASPGAYKAIIHLRSHEQVEAFAASLRVVARLPELG